MAVMEEFDRKLCGMFILLKLFAFYRKAKSFLKIIKRNHWKGLDKRSKHPTPSNIMKICQGVNKTPINMQIATERKRSPKAHKNSGKFIKFAKFTKI